jgi:hypothetical protein
MCILRLSSSPFSCSPWLHPLLALASGFLLACSGTAGGPSSDTQGLPASAASDGTPASAASEAAANDTALIPAAQPPAPGDGGQTGGIGGDLVTHTALGRDQIGPTGFSPARAMAAFAGDYSAELVYASGERTTLHVEITPNGAPISLGEDPAAQYLFESWAAHPENDSLSLGADVSFVTDDGLFQERGPYGLTVQSLTRAHTYAELALSVLQGSYTDAAGLRALAGAKGEDPQNKPKGEEPSPLWILPNVTLHDTNSVHTMTGTLLGHLPDPEAEQPGDLADLTIATW